MLGGELMNIELKEKLEKFYDEQVWPHITLGEFIEDCAKKYGDKIALVDEDVELSYQELNRKACHYANGLLKAGFKKEIESFFNFLIVTNLLLSFLPCLRLV